MTDRTSPAGFVRRMLHQYVPAHFHDPLGLARRLVKTRDPAALFAMFSAALGVVVSPLDWMLLPAERKCYRNAPPRQYPLVFVCGGPRTGTTMAAQTLVSHLPVSYFTNLSALFPRSPITARRLFGRSLGARHRESRNFYGKTTRLSGMNDSLYIWDRWLGTNRQQPPECLGAEQSRAMQQFFTAWEAVCAQPLVAKCNSLNAVAHLVDDVLDNCFFICLTREPLYTAQSLYSARLLIHGTLERPYGPTAPDALPRDDPITSVCRQVLYHQQLAQLQADRIGEDRFWRISYEQLCRDPAALVRRVGCEILGLEAEAFDRLELPAQRSANTRRLDESLLAQLEQRLTELATGSI